MLLGGSLYESALPQSPFFVSLGFTFVALLVVLFLVHEPEKRVGAITVETARPHLPAIET